MPRYRRVNAWVVALLVITASWVVSALVDSMLPTSRSFTQSLLFQIPVTETNFRITAWLAILAFTAWHQLWLRQAFKPGSKPTSALLGELYQHAPVALYRSSSDGLKLIIANDAAASLLAYPDVATMLRECQPKTLYTDPQVRDDMLTQLYSTGRCDGLHLKLNRRDGVTIWVSMTAILRTELDVIDGSMAEITAEQTFLTQLHHSEQLHRAIVTGSPLGISVRDRTGRLLMCNEAWVNIWALPPDEVRGDMQRRREKLMFDQRENYLGQRSAEVLDVYQRGGTAFIPECQTSQQRPGMAAWVSQHFYAILDDQGEVDRVVIVTEDISSRKQAELERNELYEALQQQLQHVHTLSGLLPICSGCHKIRDDSGYWHRVDMYLRKHSSLEFTHGLCPECASRLYPGLVDVEEPPDQPDNT